MDTIVNDTNLDKNIFRKVEGGYLTYSFSYLNGNLYKKNSQENIWFWFAGCEEDKTEGHINKYIQRKRSKLAIKQESERKNSKS